MRLLFHILPGDGPMKRFSRAGLTVIALTLAATAPLGAAWADHSAWRKIASTEHKVVFSPPGVQGWNPGITVSVADSPPSRSEFMCWREFGSLDANACITYQMTGGGEGWATGGFDYARVTDIPGRFGDFKKITHEFIGKVQSVPSVLGDFDTIRLNVETGFHKKKCVIFSKFISGRWGFIKGWYCARVGKDLAAETIAKTISTIGINGRKVPQLESKPEGIWAENATAGLYVNETAKKPSPQVTALSPQLRSFDGDWVLEIVEPSEMPKGVRVKTKIVDNKFRAHFAGGSWRGEVSGKIDKVGKLVGSGVVSKGDAGRLGGDAILRFSAEYLDDSFQAKVPATGVTQMTFTITLTRVSAQ